MLPDILNEEEEEAAVKENAALMKTLRDSFSPFYLTDYQFVKLFRLSKAAVHYLCCVLQPSLQRYRPSGLSVQTQVFAALRFFAIGSYQKGIGNDYLVSISQSATSRAIKAVATGIIELLTHEWIQFPTTEEKRIALKRRFQEERNFKGVIGYIDCTHVAIVKPNIHEEAYANHKGFHFINVQASAEKVTKKSRGPKATNVQIHFLVSYMEDHNDFATGKLLGARGKAAHDAQWQRLTAKLNNFNGPYKSKDAWKKLWCDQRNQARARAAKGKAQQRLTGNMGKKIEVKDLDLRILSIIGGESSIGLPIMEMGVGERLEDTVDPFLVLGLKNTTREKDLIDDDINYEETNVLTMNKENIRITDDDSNISQDSVHEEDFSQPNDKYDDSFDIYTDSISPQCAKKSSVTPFKATTLMSGERPRTSLREKLNRFHVQDNSNYQSDAEGFDASTSQFTACKIPVKEVSKRLAPKSILDRCNSKYLRNSSSEKTVNPNIQRNFLESNNQSDSVVLPSQFDDSLRQSKETSKRLTKSNRLNSKSSKNSSLEETMNYFQSTQDKQNKSSEAMVENLHRIASAVEQQNNLVKKSLALHEQTLEILAATVKDLTEKM